MSRVLVSRLTRVFVMAVISLVLVGGPAVVAQAPKEQRLGAAPPGTHGVPGDPPHLRPEEIENRISPEERERLGLPEPTWVAQHGKVHPDVRAVLETGQMPWLRFKGWAPMGFEGTAYVAVHLRHERKGKHSSKESQATLKEVQRRILSKLTAAEFSVVHIFKSTAGILGYVNSEGLAKLAQDPYVLAVTLDEQPVPEDPPPVRRGPGERRGKVNVNVYKALERATGGYVFILVTLERVQHEAVWDRQVAAVQAVYERVLSGLSADEFMVRVRARGFPSMHGHASAAGLRKLANNPDVVLVALPRPLIPVPRDMRKQP